MQIGLREKHKIYRFPWAIVIACLTIMGCVRHGTEDISLWMAEVKKTTHASIPRLPEPKIFEPLAYNISQKLLDPFNAQKLLGLKVQQGNMPDFNRPRDPLESYPLDSLKMVGTMEREGAHFALIQVNKTIFRVKVGEYIGSNFGLITKIDANSVIIKEMVQDAAGQWVERDTKLSLQEDRK